MSQMRIKNLCRQAPKSLLVMFILGVVFFPHAGRCETYGIKDADGSFAPKVTVTVEKKEIVIKKTNPRDKFRSLSLKLNPANRTLIKNVALLNVEWIGSDNKVSKPVPFAGPLYDRTTHVFQDSMQKSNGLRVIDKSSANLFAGKKLSEILVLRVDDVPVVSAESASEKERTVQMGTGRDVSLNVDKSKVIFNEGNLKIGVMVNVDNRSGLDQVVGVDLPDKGFVLCQIRRRLEQTKIPKEDWARFTLPSDQGIFIVLIPESDPDLLAQLEGKEIVIKSYQGGEVRDSRRIPIEITPDLRHGSGDIQEPPPPPKSGPTVTRTGDGPPKTPTSPQSGKAAAKESFWLWVVQIANLALLAGLGLYGLFFLLPKVQVLQDRVSKSEMFIHGSREAIREELDQIKRELIEEYRADNRKE